MKNRLSKTAQRSIGLLLLSRLFERVAFCLLLSILVNYLMDKGLFQGIYYTVLAVAGSLWFTGRSLYEKMGPMVFVIIAALLLISAIVLLWTKRSVTKKIEINQSA